jgi:uncharacterized protein (TIGR02284 family)
MKNNEEIVSDLKELLAIANDGKEGYQSAADATDNDELKAVFLRYSGERIVYEAELKEHIATHEGDAENENGGILGGLHRTWIHIKSALTSKDDTAIISAIITGERAAIAKYEEFVTDYERHADHLALIKSQQDGIKEALKEMEILAVKYHVSK